MQRQKTLIIILITVGIVAVLGFVLWQKGIIKLPTFTPTPTPIIVPVEKEITLSLVKEYNTDLEVLWRQVSSENYIYLTHLAKYGMELAVFDVSDVLNPQKIFDSNNEMASKEIETMYVKDNYLYVSGMDITDLVWIGIFDISDPTKPKGVWHQEGLIEQIGISDNYLFLLGSKFWIFDISNPEKPVLLSSRETNDIGSDAMCVSGDYVYTADKFKGFKVIDVSDKKKPIIAGEDRGYANDLLCFNNFVYGITVSYSNLNKDIFSVRDFSDIKNVKRLKVFEKEQLRDFYQIGNNLFVTYEGGILIFDISNPADPVLLKDIPGDFGLISGQGKYLYSIIDNPSNFRESLLQIFEIKYE